MPKDATKNIDRYKIRGGQLNEFDFQQNQEEFAEASKAQADIPDSRERRLRKRDEGSLPVSG